MFDRGIIKHDGSSQNGNSNQYGGLRKETISFPKCECIGCKCIWV